VYASESAPAEAIAHALRVDDFIVELADACVAGAPPPEDYDAVVIVAQPNWLNYTHAIDAYVREHPRGLQDRPTRTFTVPRWWSRRSIDTLAIAFAREFGDAIPSSIVERT
jgi:menaquinone-dependent protoporphyrinogen IX oxidase